MIITLKIETKDLLRSRKPHAGRRKGRKMPFLSLVTLTFDLESCAYLVRFIMCLCLLAVLNG